MTDQQQFEIALKHLVRIATAIERHGMIMAKLCTVVEELNTTLQEVIVQGKSGRSYLSTVVKRSPE
jgi:hypothetical protein